MIVDTFDQNVKDKFIVLLKEEGVRFSKQGKVRLDDLVTNIIQSKSTKLYVDKVKCKILVGKIFYVTIDDAYSIVIQGNSKICRRISDSLELVNVSGGSIVDISKNIFQYDGQKFVTFLIDNDNGEQELWVKGSHVCKFLGYDNEAQALSTHVKKKNTLTFDNLCPLLKSDSAKKITANTIFINFSGFCNLIHGSTKPFAESMRNWLDDDVLPALFKHGTYSMQPPSINIPNFYDKSAISPFYKKTVLYIGYVGKIDKDGKIAKTGLTFEHTFKFGLSRKMFKRDKKQHSVQFEIFKVVTILESDNAELIEKMFKRDLISFQVYRNRIINGKSQTELFTVSAKHPIESLIDHLKSLVINNRLPALVEADQIIRESNIKNDQYRSLIIAHQTADQIRLLKAQYKMSDNFRAEIEFMKSHDYLAKLDRDIQIEQLKFQTQLSKTYQVALEHGYSPQSIAHSHQIVHFPQKTITHTKISSPQIPENPVESDSYSCHSDSLGDISEQSDSADSSQSHDSAPSESSDSFESTPHYVENSKISYPRNRRKNRILIL